MNSDIFVPKPDVKVLNEDGKVLRKRKFDYLRQRFLESYVSPEGTRKLR